MSYTYNNEIRFERNEQLDSFGRLRVSDLTTYFDSPLKHHEEIYIWDTKISGSATSTYSTSETMLINTVSNNGDSVKRQTKEYFQLQNGKSHFGFIGVVMGSPEANVTKSCGLYNDSNGFIFKQKSDGTYSLSVRTSITGSITESEISQSNWNIDTLDGNGPSGLDVDFSKLQVLYLDLSYSGNGNLRFGVMVDNKIVLAHSFTSFNLYETGSFTTPSLPITYEITSTGGESTLKQQSCCILVEGDYNKRGIPRSVNTGPEPVEVDGETKPMISLRLKSQYRKSIIIPDHYSILHTSSKSTIFYEIYMFGSLTGASWNDSQSGTNSIAEYDVSATSLTGGVLIDSGYIPPNTTNTVNRKIENILKLSGDIDGNTDIITIIITNLDKKAPCYVALNYYEVY